MFISRTSALCFFTLVFLDIVCSARWAGVQFWFSWSQHNTIVLALHSVYFHQLCCCFKLGFPDFYIHLSFLIFISTYHSPLAMHEIPTSIPNLVISTPCALRFSLRGFSCGAPTSCWSCQLARTSWPWLPKITQPLWSSSLTLLKKLDASVCCVAVRTHS